MLIGRFSIVFLEFMGGLLLMFVVRMIFWCILSVCREYVWMFLFSSFCV